MSERSHFTKVGALAVGMLAATAGCGSNFTAESIVEGLRILGIRAEPADLHPGESTRLTSLVVDPSRGPSDFTVLWFLCDPDPFNLNRSACSDTAVLSDSPLFSRTPTQSAALPPGMHLIGVNGSPSFSAAPDLFSPLATDDSRRITGTVAELLVFAVAEGLPPVPNPDQLQSLFDRIRAKTVPSVTGLFRVRISEDPQRNHNPQLGRLVVNGSALPSRAILRITFGASISLDMEVTADSFEEYDQLTPSGIEHRQERLIAAYYTTVGHLSNDRVSLRSGTIASLVLSGDTGIVPSRRGVLWVVVRDTRGGVSWIEVPAFVCDPSRPTPGVNSLTTRPVPGGLLVSLKGTLLEEILDVWVDDIPLGNAQFIAGNQTFTGTAPPLAPGQHSVTIRSTNCNDPPPLTFSL